MRFRRSKIIFFVVLTALSATYIGGCRGAGTWLVKAEVPPGADAIVLLMGSFPERVLEATDQYHKGIARRILIVYESMGPYQMLVSRGAEVIRTTEQAHNAAVTLGVPADSITMLPGDARSTLDEALAVRSFIKNKPDIDTLLLVSSPAHMRRAAMIFKSALRNLSDEVYVGCVPSSYSGFNPDRWWRRKEDVQTVLSEYLKIASFVLFEKRDMNKRIAD